MPTSLKKIEANRRNAQKSTGPKTPEGKARVSQNAVKHGLYARKLILNSAHVKERETDYISLCHNYLAAFDPRSRLEQILIQRIANCLWHIERAEHSPASHFPDILDPSVNLTDDQLFAVGKLHYKYLRVKRRLMHRVEKTHSLLMGVKHSQTPIESQQLAEALLGGRTLCATEPKLERVI